MRTMEQKRAKYAYEKVIEAARPDNGIKNDEYKSHAASLPAMIHTNGLGQAAAFYKSKGGAREKLYNLLSEWLTRKEHPYGNGNYGKSDLIKGIVNEDMHTYRMAQSEAQALMSWVKKAATAYMREDPSGKEI
ncbi:MAG: type III-B CRISPR module-associated protein Cmr5 [Candidatus Electrothrix sp. ATG2]|nr:type III-B CRISPR module-associated protein Cmr5 [Candidatus Electrothrix sp. ATG2]